MEPSLLSIISFSSISKNLPTSTYSANLQNKCIVLLLSCLACFSMMIFSSMVVQPQSIKINQQDQAANGGQAAQKSACCG